SVPRPYRPPASPTSRPTPLPKRRWIPPSRRLRAFSLAAAEKLANERVTPGRSGVVEVKAMPSVPKNPARAVAAAAPYALCPDEYDGCAGVGISGVQSGSIRVSGLPSVSAARMAVTGRQKLYVYLVSQVSMCASAPARFMRANSRAFCDRVKPWASDTPAAIWFQCLGDGSAQNRAISVPSALRMVLLAAPSSLTSLKAAVYSRLVSAGGPAARNRSPLGMANGVTPPQCGATGDAKAGGVGCQAPGSVPGGYGTTPPGRTRRPGASPGGGGRPSCPGRCRRSGAGRRGCRPATAPGPRRSGPSGSGTG